MERLWEQLPFSREQTCPCNLSGYSVSFVVGDFSARFFTGLGKQSLAFSVWAYDSLRLLHLRAGLQSLREVQESSKLRLAVGCCVHRFPSFPRLDHDAVVFPWGGLLKPVATERRVVRVYGLRFEVDEIRDAVNTRVCKVESPAWSPCSTPSSPA